MLSSTTDVKTDTAPSATTTTYVVTGANSGLGFEACRQLAKDHNASKVILACRNADKANAAVETLVKLTGKPASMFEVLVMSSDSESARAAADKLGDGSVNGVILNAGGMGGKNYRELTKEGVSTMFSANVLGAAVFLQNIIKKGKLAANACIVYSGSEGARGVNQMQMPVPVFTEKTADHLADHMTGKAFKKFTQYSSYGDAKAVATLYMSAMARKHPELKFITMSPGMTMGTSVAKDMNALTRCLLQCLGPCLVGKGNSHNVETGAKRYMDALFNTEMKSGAFMASAAGKLSGPVVDVSTYDAKFSDVELQDAAKEALHRFMTDAEAEE